MYQQDSLFDLPPLGQLGLVGLSLLLCAIMLLAARLLLRNRAIWIRLAGALVLFWLFLWLSPQVYYEYYRLLIPTLPVQWVIWPPRTPAEAVTILFFQGPRSLSAHGQAILGWCLVALPLIRVPRMRRGQC